MDPDGHRLSASHTLAVNLKAYLDAPGTRAWCAAARDAAIGNQAMRQGRIALVVIPSMPLVPSAVAWFSGTPVLIGAQDVSMDGRGPHTGEVPAELLAQVGCRVVVVGHAERRRAGDDDAIVARKVARVLEAGLMPLLCVGEPRADEAEQAGEAERAAEWVIDQMRVVLAGAPPGPVLVAYEPVWAIGAAQAAPAAHVRTVAGALGAWLAGATGRQGSQVLYGGAAGPEELDLLDGPIDGLFLGRSVHDPTVLASMLGRLDTHPGPTGRS